jgi:hypothetical protein
MLDNSILSHSQFAEWRSIIAEVVRDGNLHSVQQLGLVRRKADPNFAYQSQMDALFTIGRLIRERRIYGFTYAELSLEGWKRNVGEQAFDALGDCKIESCHAPMERSRFFKAGRFEDYMAKGGKKDRKAGKNLSMSQIRFVQMLLDLTEDNVRELISLREMLQITPFEIESLHNLPWFRTMCRVAQSPENYPDMFHVWAAQRNRMDVFLTLEITLTNIAAKFPVNKSCLASFPTSVLRPLQLLERLGIEETDPVPIKAGHFYPIFGQPFPINDRASQL